MRRLKTLARVTAGMLLAVAGGTAAAQDTTTFQVTANVIAFCDVTAEDMDFGDFDGTVDLLATSEISVTCTEDHPYQVTLNAGSAAGSTVANRLLSNGTDTLAYSLYRDPARTLPWYPDFQAKVGDIVHALLLGQATPKKTVEDLTAAANSAQKGRSL